MTKRTYFWICLNAILYGAFIGMVVAMFTGLFGVHS